MLYGGYKMNEEKIITEELLLKFGFELNETETKLCKGYYLEKCGIKDYKTFRKWTNDKYPIKLDIDNGWTNSGRRWSLHIDNSDCETIGYADVDYVWQFNKLMEVFNSNFRL